MRCAEGRASRGGPAAGGGARWAVATLFDVLGGDRRARTVGSALRALSWHGCPHLRSFAHMVGCLVQGCTVGVRRGCGRCGGEVQWWWAGYRAGGH